MIPGMISGITDQLDEWYDKMNHRGETSVLALSYLRWLL